MVLLEIYIEGIAGDELEGNAPGSVDVDRKPLRNALQTVKLVAGYVHVIWTTCGIKGIKAFLNAIVKALIDLRPAALPELSKLLASESLDHLK